MSKFVQKLVKLMKRLEIALIVLTVAAAFFSVGYFTGRSVGGDVQVTVEKAEEDRTLPEAEDGDRVNINTATSWQLMELPGVGEVLAGRIVEYRERHGAFRYISEIMNVQGVRETIYNGIKNKITV